MLIKRTERNARRGSLATLAGTSDRGLDRRSFLARSGLVAGGLAGLGSLPLAGVRKAEAGPPPPPGAAVTIRKNICTHCSVGCTVVAEVVNGVWTGQEQKNFQAVIDGFTKKNPDVKIKYTSSGDQTPTVLSTAVQGGNPPDLASVSQPGLVTDFQKKGALKPMDFARKTVLANYPADIEKLGEIGGHLYGLIIKAANKSTVWYNVKAYSDAGVKAPTTWDQFIKDAGTLKASGLPAYSIGGADGWTLTDLFENIYLRQAGPAKYDQLSKHQIK